MLSFWKHNMCCQKILPAQIFNSVLWKNESKRLSIGLGFRSYSKLDISLGFPILEPKFTNFLPQQLSFDDWWFSRRRKTRTAFFHDIFLNSLFARGHGANNEFKKISWKNEYFDFNENVQFQIEKWETRKTF